MTSIVSTILPLIVTISMIASAMSYHAHSFQHYHGPVEGPHHQITWSDKHGHHYHDYVAHPSYKFSYGVEDHHTKDYHGQKEHRDGKGYDFQQLEIHENSSTGHHLTGEYHLHEPGGNVRTVKYHADEHGFHPIVYNSGGIDHHY